MSARNIPVSKGRLAHKTDKLTAICTLIIYKLWEPRRPVTGITLPFLSLPQILLERLALNNTAEQILTF
jgi:hypothetical protein